MTSELFHGVHRCNANVWLHRCNQNMSVLSPSQGKLIADHSAITFDIATPFKARPKIKRTVFDYNRGNFNELRATLETVDLCGAVESAVDINHGWLKWKELFISGARGSIPVKIRLGSTVRYSTLSGKGDCASETENIANGRTEKQVQGSAVQGETIDHGKSLSVLRKHQRKLFNNPKRFWSVFKINSKRASVLGTITVGSNGLNPDSAR